MPSRTACSPGTSQDLLQSASTCPWSDSCTWAALNDDSCNWAPSAPRASTTSSTATQAVPCGKYRQHLQIEQSMPNESKIDMHDTHCIGLVGTQAAHILAAYVALQLSPPPLPAPTTVVKLRQPHRTITSETGSTCHRCSATHRLKWLNCPPKLLDLHPQGRVCRKQAQLHSKRRSTSVVLHAMIHSRPLRHVIISCIGAAHRSAALKQLLVTSSEPMARTTCVMV